MDNYFGLSPILLEDMNALLDEENDSQPGRRNFIRASASLIEGYAADWMRRSARHEAVK
ncbi:MAG: hypothetical protein ACREYC_13340 [Gammaproteobacteria bacterium]